MRALKLAMALCLFMSFAKAEDFSYLLNTTPGERAASQTRFMHSKLSLSADDLIQVQAINQQYAEKTEPILKGSSVAWLKMLDIKSVQAQKEKELQRVLTHEQFETYLNAKDELMLFMRQDLRR